MQSDRDAPRVAQRLREAGLTARLLRDLPARHAALRDDPAALAVRRFRDGIALTPDESATLFGDCDPPPYRALDIVEDLYLFSDPDDVLGPSQTTAILYRAERQIRASSVLDLGCGCGTLALLLARNAGRVVGTDINPLAVEIARYNAAANGIANVEFRAGDLFEPVAQERFDLLVSQPPYIPRAADAAPNPYYHAGSRGDEIARAIVEGAPRHLTPDGCALIFSDWPLALGETLRDRIPYRGMQATVFASPAIDPADYFAPQSAGIAAVHNCLVWLRPGAGYTQREILPHQWGEIDIESNR